MNLRFNWEDASQVIIGAFSLSVPVAFTEEAWKLSESLPLLNLISVVAISISFLSVFTYHSVFSRRPSRQFIFAFGIRVMLGYGLALLVVCLVLFSLNRLPILSSPAVTLKRVLIVGLPASMGAVVVDSFDKESWPD